MHRKGRSDIRLNTLDSMIPLRFDRRRLLLRQMGHNVGTVILLVRKPIRPPAITPMGLRQFANRKFEMARKGIVRSQPWLQCVFALSRHLQMESSPRRHLGTVLFCTFQRFHPRGSAQPANEWRNIADVCSIAQLCGRRAQIVETGRFRNRDSLTESTDRQTVARPRTTNERRITS